MSQTPTGGGGLEEPCYSFVVEVLCDHNINEIIVTTELAKILRGGGLVQTAAWVVGLGLGNLNLMSVPPTD